MTAPASNHAATAGAVEAAGFDPSVLSQSGCPNPVLCPATSYISLIAHFRFDRGPPGVAECGTFTKASWLSVQTITAVRRFTSPSPTSRSECWKTSNSGIDESTDIRLHAHSPRTPAHATVQSSTSNRHATCEQASRQHIRSIVALMTKGDTLIHITVHTFDSKHNRLTTKLPPRSCLLRLIPSSHDLPVTAYGDAKQRAQLCRLHLLAGGSSSSGPERRQPRGRRDDRRHARRPPGLRSHLGLRLQGGWGEPPMSLW